MNADGAEASSTGGEDTRKVQIAKLRESVANRRNALLSASGRLSQKQDPSPESTAVTSDIRR